MSYYISHCRKEDFTNQLDFEAAQKAADTQYEGVKPIDQKVANMCLRDTVAVYRGVTTLSVGECEVEECTYKAAKLEGVTGVCLKATVGVEQPEVQ